MQVFQMIITFDYFYLENHSHIIKRYALYISKNAQGVFNKVKYRKQVNEDNCIYNNNIIIQTNGIKGKKAWTL